MVGRNSVQAGKNLLSLNSRAISLVDTDADELVRYFTKREYVEKLLIEIREHPSDRQMKSVRDVMKDLFQIPTVGEEDDALIKSFKDRARNLLVKLKDLFAGIPRGVAFPRQEDFRGRAEVDERGRGYHGAHGILPLCGCA